MKSLTVKPKITAGDFYKPETIATIRRVVAEVMASIEESRQKCFILGQILNEAKAVLVHGEFQEYIQKHFPEISYDTANRYAKAAHNILLALPAPELEMEISQVITLPDESLSDAQKEYKQQWLDFTRDKSVGKAMKGSFLDNDPAVGLLRGAGGKSTGGAGRQDRKEFEKFTATKLGHITTFLTVQKKMAGTGKKKSIGPRQLSPVQQAQISAAFINFLETAPNWLLITLHDKINTESKLSEPQRYSR